jgi:hypothetical protein
VCFFDLAVDKARLRYRSLLSTANFKVALQVESAIHKLRIVLKEVNETSIWLRVIERSQLVKKELLTDLTGENRELCKIFTVSLRTVRKRIR